MPAPLDLAGMRFGRLVALSRATSLMQKTQWVCICDCGKTKTVGAAMLRRGTTQSCGCLRTEWKAIFGQARKGIETATLPKQYSREFKVWTAMKQRCFNPSCGSFHNYGGRGITVCSRWLEFAPFLEDMGPRPAGGLSLDRIDVNGNYEPSNCRWATARTQSGNKRANTSITHAGKTATVVEWSEITGLEPNTITYRIRAGWPAERALTTPSTINRKQSHVV